jgi:hypothetical protein
MPLKYTEPEGDLARELREVARDAQALENVLSQNLNVRIPDDFPKAQLIELVHALVRLPSGTAEGSLAALEYARNRLPAIRRAHVLSEEIEDGRDLEEAPSLVRGALVDQKLRDLIASVTTALDEYRRAAGYEALTEYEVERGVTAPPTTTRDALASSEALDSNFAEFNSTVEAVTAPASKHADALTRQISDARGLNRLARVELKMPKVVVGWYRKTVDALGAYPDVIRKTAVKLKDGADIVQIGLERWHDFKHNGLSFFVSEFKKTCDSLGLVADKLDELRQTKFGSVASTDDGGRSADDDEDDRPGDFDEQKTTDMLIDGKVPPEHWWPFILRVRTTTRARRGRLLKNLAPISAFENLFYLDLHKTSAEITNFEPLKKNRNLEVLCLPNGRMQDLNWISGLTKLEFLNLSGSTVVDISGLSGLPNLETVNLSYCKISDLTPLTTLPNLRKLILRWCECSDYSFLSKCTGLTELNLQYSSIRDLKVLRPLTQLETLNVNFTKVSDITPLAKLKKLDHLEVSFTNINSLEAVSHLMNLEYVEFFNTKVKSVQPLARLPNLTYVGADGSLVKDLSPLEHIADLEISGASRKWVARPRKRKRYSLGYLEP